MNPLVSILVLNWNNFDDTNNCVTSLLSLNYNNFNILIIDNGSTDNSFIRLKNKFRDERIIFLKNKENFGYAGGINIGIKYVFEKLSSDFIWILNNDIMVDKDSLKFLIDAVNKNKKIGIAGPTIYLAGTKKIMEQYYRLNLLFGRFLVKTNLNENEVVKIENKKNNYIGGAAVFLRKEILNKIGYIPEEYFMYNEDIAWHQKIKNTQLEYLYVGPAKVWHKKGASSGGKKTIMPDYYDSRNFLYFIKKFYPLWLPYEFFMSIINKVFPKVLRGEWERLRYVFMGFRDFAKGKMGKFEN